MQLYTILFLDVIGIGSHTGKFMNFIKILLIMAPEGGHLGFDLTTCIVFGLSGNFYCGYNIAKEVD